MKRRVPLVLRFVHRGRIAGEVVGSFWRMGRWWLIPLVIFLLLATVIVVVAQFTPLGPFMYAVF